jgi:death on curing protein
MIFLNKKLVLRVQFQLIEATGGAHGLRDEGGLESALNAAENRAFYENAALKVCAATYAFHLCKAHAFIDGNKRIAAAVTETFLELNGATLEISNDELVDLFLKIAAGEMTREAVEQFFAKNVRLKE